MQATPANQSYNLTLAQQTSFANGTSLVPATPKGKMPKADKIKGLF